MQNECVDNKDLISIGNSLLKKYYQNTNAEIKTRYFNYLYALISCRITNSCIDEYSDLYEWIHKDKVTTRIFENILDNKLDSAVKDFTLVHAITSIERELLQLKKLLNSKGVI